MDHDGTKNGYDLEFLAQVVKNVTIPVIASGGAGESKHFLDAFRIGIDACLAATLFHYEELAIKDLKQYLQSNGIRVRQ